jgi:release factor glutamine methyltransferase
VGSAGSREEGNVTWAEMTAHVAAELGDRNEARWVCETAGGFDAAELRAAAGEWVPERAGKQIESMLRRRLAGEPLQYVLGRWGFRRLDLMVDARVLIPRPETELVVDIVTAAARGAGPGATVVDLGTGSGAIGLAVLDELPPGHATVWMTDASADALDVARANAAGAGRAAMGARFAHGNWYGALDGSLRGAVDVIVSNPPYIAEGDPDLEESVRAWEPSSALLAGSDGLDDLRVIVAGAPEWLRPGGLIVVEMGHTQTDELIDLYQLAGMDDVRVHRDLAGRDRFVSGRRA